MLAEKQTAPPPPPSASRRLWQWLNWLLTLGLTAVGLWFIARNVTLADIGDTTAAALRGRGVRVDPGASVAVLPGRELEAVAGAEHRRAGHHP